MKKSQLKKIELHQRPSEDYGQEYVLVASKEQVGGEECLHVSFFINKGARKKKKLPDFRVFFSKDNHVTEKIEDASNRKWSTAKIMSLVERSGDYLGWYERDKGKACVNTREEELLIYNFLDDYGIFDLSDLEVKVDEIKELSMMSKFQDKCAEHKLKLAHDRVKSRIDEDMDRVKKLPADFEKWVKTVVFEKSQYVFYKVAGTSVDCHCSVCREDFQMTNAEKKKRKIIHGSQGKCPNCNAKVSFKANGRSTSIYDWYRFSIFQKVEGGYVARYFSGSVDFRISREKNQLEKRNPKHYISESYRTFFNVVDGWIVPGKRYEWNNFKQTGDMRWCDHDYNYHYERAVLYPSNIRKVLKDTNYRYSALYELAKPAKSIEIEDFLRIYREFPKVEMLIKAGFYNLVSNMSIGRPSTCGGLNFGKKKIEDIFDLKKDYILEAAKNDISSEGLIFMQELMSFSRIDFKDLRWVLKNIESYEAFQYLANYTTPYKMTKYIKSQIGDYPSYDQVLIEWRDYIRDCSQLKRDLKNTFYLFPKNLHQRHSDTKFHLDYEKVKQYEESLQNVSKQLEWTIEKSKKLLIRPATSIKEIIDEGAKQHHCVGGSGYISRMARGSSIIYLVRKIDDPDKPYYTVEYNLESNRIAQCQGLRRILPTPEVNKFLDSWKRKIAKEKNKLKIGA